MKQKASDPKILTGAQLAARALRANDVSCVFALCGDHVNALFHAIQGEGIEIVGARHESAAVQMADGWARATGRPGIAIVTGGPGHTNAVTGAAVAQGAQSPVVIISGQAVKNLRDRGGNQSLHQADLMRPVTKWAVEAESAEGAAEFLVRALAVALDGTPGPVSVSIPVDIANSFATEAFGPARQGGMPARSVEPPTPSVTPLARLLEHAKRPVAVVGGHAWSHGSAGQLSRTIRALGLPCFTNGQSRGVVPDDGDYCFGYANPLFNSTFRAISQADLLLLIGTTLDYSFGSGKNHVIDRDARILQVHRDPAQIGVGRAPHAAVVGDHGHVLRALEAELKGKGVAVQWKSWRRALQIHHAQKHAYWRKQTGAQRPAKRGIHPAAVCKALARHCSATTTLVFDVGDFTNWPKAWFAAHSPGRFMDGGALGNLGGAVPIAIGAQIARNSSPVWAFTGDGGFGFHGWELSLAAERSLPLKLILGNDRSWGTEKRLQLAEFGSDIACDLPPIRYDRFANLLGVRAFRVTREADLRDTVARFAAVRGPSLLQIDVQPLAGRPFQVETAN